MGRARSHNKMHMTGAERADGMGGYSGPKSTGDKVEALPWNYCPLTGAPLKTAMVSPSSGVMYDLVAIVPFVKAHHVDPVSGDKLELRDLVKLVWDVSPEGDKRCPLTFKLFSDNTSLIALKTTGRVFSGSAKSTLLRSMKDPVDNSSFTQADVIDLYDPSDLSMRSSSNWHYIQAGLPANPTKAASNARASASGPPGTSGVDTSKIRVNPTTAAIFKQMAAAGAGSASDGKVESVDGTALPNDLYDARHNDRGVTGTGIGSGNLVGKMTTGRRAASFTSSAIDLRTSDRLLNDDEREAMEAGVEGSDDEPVVKVTSKGRATVHTSLGDLHVEIDADLVPLTARNWLTLAEEGKFNNTTFHRIIPNFMAQGGDPTGTGTGGSSIYKDGEAFRDEFHPSLRHSSRGILSMANSGPNTNRAQWFVTFKSAPHLDRKHAVFGRLVGGAAVLSKLEAVETSGKPDNKPLTPVVITGVDVWDNPFTPEAIAAAAEAKSNPTKVSAKDAARRAAADEADSTTDAGARGAFYSAPSAAVRAARGAGVSGSSGSGSVGKYLTLPPAKTTSASSTIGVKRSAPPTARGQPAIPTAKRKTIWGGAANQKGSDKPWSFSKW